MAPDIDKIYQQAMVSIDSAVSSEELEKIRIEYLGKKGKITNLLKSLGVLPPEQRPLVGKEINALKKDFIQSVESRLNFIQKNLSRKRSNRRPRYFFARKTFFQSWLCASDNPDFRKNSVNFSKRWFFTGFRARNRDRLLQFRSTKYPVTSSRPRHA